MTDRWGSPKCWWIAGLPLETSAQLTVGTPDVNSVVNIGYLRQMGFGGNFVGTVVVSEALVTRAEG